MPSVKSATFVLDGSTVLIEPDCEGASEERASVAFIAPELIWVVGDGDGDRSGSGGTDGGGFDISEIGANDGNGDVGSEGLNGHSGKDGMGDGAGSGGGG